MSDQQDDLILSPEEAEKAGREEYERRKNLEESLGVAASKIRNRFKLPLHEMVVTATEDLPEELKVRVTRSFEPIREFCEGFQESAITEEELKKLEELKVPQEMIERIRGRQISPEKVEEFLKKQVDRISMEVRNSFVADMGKDEEGKEVSMPNKNFSRLQIQQEINRLLEKDHDPESLKKIARISFDLNGLKAVNDLNGSHEKGDAYLRLVKDVLDDPSLAVFAKGLGLSFAAAASRDGGDEFGLIVTSELAIQTEALNDLQEEIKRRLSALDATQCLDFQDEKVLLHYGRITGKKEEEFYRKSEEEKKAILDAIKKDIPADYEFTANVSCGAATLYDSMLDSENDKDDDNKIKPEEDYGRILKKMMSCLFNTSDARMQKNKEKFKQAIATGNDHEKMLSRVYTRTDKELEQVRQLQEKEKKIFLLNSLNSLRKDWKELTKVSDSEAALAEKEAAIAKLEDELMKME